MRRRLIKLVRDRVEDVVGSDLVINFAPVPDDEVMPALRAKLLEEVGEYLMAPGVPELVDVYEVLMALVYEEGLDLERLQIEAGKKTHARGGFYNGLGMYAQSLEEAP